MNVIGIDPSTSATGLAIWNRRFVTIKTGQPAERYIARLHELYERLCFTLDRIEVDLAMIEVVPMHGPQPLAKIRLAELGGVFRMALFERGVDIVEVNPMSLKKYATDNGTAQKHDMVKAARERGWQVSNDNEADAAWLCQLGIDHYADIIAYDRLQDHQKALHDKLTWPTTAR